MLRFQGEEYRAPSSLHTNHKVAQKDPIFPPKINSNVTFNTTTRCKRNINLSAYKNSQSQSFYILANLHFDLYLWEEERRGLSPTKKDIFHF